MPGTPKIPRDTAGGTELSYSELSTFAALIKGSWTIEDEYTAHQRELAAATSHLQYLRWLRNVQLP